MQHKTLRLEKKDYVHNFFVQFERQKPNPHKQLHYSNLEKTNPLFTSLSFCDGQKPFKGDSY